ncbi:SRSF protein kinase 3-like [Drosophila eugracilis]|uniref:SRSF protein kinase 3-like n=1 Tax=Drosophila eugracilis TaxID=29029 RepID=UPI0007E6590B|nr:SRSF protein kinase 3-like [Drosophila eugracilis]
MKRYFKMPCGLTNEPSTSELIKESKKLSKEMDQQFEELEQHCEKFRREHGNLVAETEERFKNKQTTKPINLNRPDELERLRDAFSEAADMISRSNSECDSNDEYYDPRLSFNKGLEESSSEYRAGGYHPVAIGDIFNHRYHAIRKLGWGHFSTVWLCYDCAMDRYCAIKVVKSADHFTETARDEIRLLLTVDKNGSHSMRERIIEFIEHFYISGSSGTHLCLVFELLGDNLLTLIRKSRFPGLPLGNIKQIARQVLEGLYFLHNKCHIIHTDIKPENILLVANEMTIRSQVNRTTNAFLKVQAQKQKSSSARGNLSDRRREASSNPYDMKMTKTAKRRMRARSKKVISFFENHRRWLRRQGTLDLLGMALNDRLSPITAALGVTDMLPFMTFNFDGLVILKETDLAKLQNMAKVERVGDMLAVHLNDDSPEGQAKRQRKVNVKDKTIEQILEENLDPLTLLLKSPLQFMRYVLRQVIISDRAIHEASHSLSRNQRKSLNGHSHGHGHGHQHQKKKPGSKPNKSPDSKFKSRGPVFNLYPLDPANEYCRLNVKIADMGNGCWFDHHYTDDIQTREYRSVEVILGAGYNETADIWSAACLFWELATGTYLFDPQSNRGSASLDEAHLARIIETCGPIPRGLVENGDYSSDIFTEHGQLRNITHLKSRKLVPILVDQYGWDIQEARDFVAFLKPMLDTDPSRRISAREAMDDYWLLDEWVGSEEENRERYRNKMPGSTRSEVEEEPRPGTPDPR